jgi:hypothetical protein
MDNHQEIHKAIWEVFHFDPRERPIPWGSSMRYKRDLLGELFAKAGYVKGAEIGVRRGKFTKILCDANPSLHMICVDPWMAYGFRYDEAKQESIYQECLANLKDYNVTLIRKTSMDALADVVDESLDFVYIDGNHFFDYVMEDIIHWSRKVRSGGIIACHDFHYGSNVDVVAAVEAYVKAYHIDPWYVTKENQPTAYWVKP